MLSERDTKLLCEVGPGTPMGELFRRFWMPVLLSDELPGPDCTPRAVRILGEDLVCFRDSNGDVGVLDAYCPHRHAHLYWGRNEDCGLRCTYHGWKFDVEGNCVDMPNEPPESTFAERIHQTAYPTKEAGGCIWAYMGPRELMPADLPHLEWLRVPESHLLMTKRLQLSNWAQAVEGGIDSAHISFLHSRLDNRPRMAGSGMLVDNAGKPVEPSSGIGGGEAEVLEAARGAAGDRSPRFWTSPRDFGFMVAARRNATSGNEYYWRLTPFLLPSFTIIPGGDREDRSIGGHVWVPIDDEHVWTFSMTYNTERPLTQEERDTHLEGMGIHTLVDKESPDWDLSTSNSYLPIRNRGNNYQIDREEQRTRTYSGIKGISEQDMSIQEAMGKVSPRWKEHLGTTDKAIIEFRRVMLDLARDLLEGKEPEQPHHPEYYRVRSAAFNLAQEVSWEEGSVPYTTARV